MTPEVKTALAWFEHNNNLAPISFSLFHGWVLTGEVRAQAARTCNRCENSMQYRNGESLNCTNIPGNYDCALFGNTCGAWKKRETVA